MIEGSVPVAGSNGVIGHHNKSTTDAPGVTIGRSGNLGNAYLYREDFWAHNTTLYVRDFKGNNEIFVYYFLKNIDFKQFNVGSAVPTLNRNHIHPLNIRIPSTQKEQKAIAAVLSSLDDKIDLLQRQNQTLEALAQTLFRQWFTEEEQDTWEESTLNNVLTAVGGTTPSTKNPDFWNGEIHWTTPRDLSNNNSPYLLDTARKITKTGLAKISSGLLPKGVLLMSSRAPVGYLAFSENPIAINQGYIAILDNKGLSKHFLYLWLIENMDYVKSYASGTTFQEISKSAFRTLDITIPPTDLRNEFEQIVSPLFEKIRKNVHQICTLEKLRDTLLPKLMSGKARVR